LRAVLLVLKISALVYLGFGVLLYAAQRTLMYFPIPERPSEDLEVVWLDLDDVRLKLWVVNPGQPRAVLYFGGNAEDVYLNAEDLARSVPGRTAYLINYRGYGGSTGRPNEPALYADALAVFDDVSERHQDVAAVGRSLGSAVATYLASRRPVDRLVLVTPYDSAVAVARRIYPVYPVEWLLKDRYESVRYATRVKAPTLIVTAEQDRVIPLEHSQRLAEAFDQAPVERLVIAGTGHNSISGPQAYWRGIADFLAP
jgi:pimeloyl-ACP methyl ester carboxylesterase